MTDNCKDFLLISANIGSIFDYPDRLFPTWVDNVVDVVKTTQPLFIAIHCQEVGGKNYEDSMQHVDRFMKMILTNSILACYSKARIYLDEDFTIEEKFTALGSMYFVHESVTDVEHWDFIENAFVQVEGREVFSANIEHVAHKYKEKFPLDFFPERKWSRKGFMHTKWKIFNQTLDFVNIHLFHDICNLTPILKNARTYADNRKQALEYAVNKASKDLTSDVALFVFGDFNFRLNTQKLVKELVEPKSSLENIYKKSQGKLEEVCKIVYRSFEILKEHANKEEEHHQQKLSASPMQTILEVGRRHFEFYDKALPFYEEKDQFRIFDEEPNYFKDLLEEFSVNFPPSYPFSEDVGCNTVYMRTRCPSWCDRVLLNKAASKLLDCVRGVDYSMVGLQACMGDHKPIQLAFFLRPPLQYDGVVCPTVSDLAPKGGINLHPVSTAAAPSPQKTPAPHEDITDPLTNTTSLPPITPAASAFDTHPEVTAADIASSTSPCLPRAATSNNSSHRRLFHSTVIQNPRTDKRYSIVDCINGMRYSAPKTTIKRQPEASPEEDEWNIFDNARFNNEQALDLRFRLQHRPYGSMDGLVDSSQHNSVSGLFALTAKTVSMAETVLAAMRQSRDGRRISESSTSTASDHDVEPTLQDITVETKCMSSQPPTNNSHSLPTSDATLPLKKKAYLLGRQQHRVIKCCLMS